MGSRVGGPQSAMMIAAAQDPDGAATNCRPAGCGPYQQLQAKSVLQM